MAGVLARAEPPPRAPCARPDVSPAQSVSEAMTGLARRHSSWVPERPWPNGCRFRNTFVELKSGVRCGLAAA